MVSLPGAYPLDESAPATPNEPMPQPHHAHPKLHKPNDPRSHQQTDSGVGVNPFDQHQDSSLTQESRTSGSYVTGGHNYTLDPIKPFTAVGSGPIRDKFQRDPQSNERHTEMPGVETSEQSRHIETEQIGSERPETNSAIRKDDPEVPPYWGNLPQGQRGGIYNTVTGHGSSKDDHAQHHHIPDRSAKTDHAHIAGAVVPEHLKGGTAYNSVAGHGSYDEEDMRHNQSLQPKSESGTINSTDAVLDAPLVGIPEHKPLQSRDFATSSMPETAAGDDSKLLSRAQEAPRVQFTGIPAAATSHPESTTAKSGPKSDTMHQRAFPLGPSNMLADDDAMMSRSDNHEDPTLTYADGLGTGIAVSQHDANRDASRTSSERQGRNRLSKSDNGKVRQERSKSRGDGSPKGEKKHHKILGIFSRNKDDKSPEDTSKVDPPRERSPRHSQHRKEEMATSAALGAGATALVNRHRDDRSKDRSPPSEPTRQDDRTKSASRRESAPSNSNHLGLLRHHEDKQDLKHAYRADENKARRQSNPPLATSNSAAGTTQGQPQGDKTVPNFSQPTSTDNSHAGAMAAAGVGASAGAGAYQATRGRRVSNPHPQSATTGPSFATGGQDTFENPRAPPTNPAAESRAFSNSSGPGATSGTVTNEPGDYNSLKSGTPSGVAAGIPSRRVSRSQDRAQMNESSKEYNVLPYRTTSRVEPHSSAEARVTNKPEDSNTLSSGTTSGVATDTPSHGDNAKRRDSSPSYNVLASGTPSGVKVEPHKHRTSEDRSRKSGDYNTLPSGTASGSNTDSGLLEPLRDHAAEKNTSSGFVSVPITSAPRSHDGHGQVQDDNQNSADQGKNMSPEVMPSAYTASAPRPDRNAYNDANERAKHMSPEVMPSSYVAPAPRPDTFLSNHNAPEERVKHMSPEVMPSSYTTSAPRGDFSPKMNQSSFATDQSQNAPSSRLGDIDPALAAARAASGAGPMVVGGAGWPTQQRGPGGKTVLHKCDHCGRDNDITAYVAKQNGGV